MSSMNKHRNRSITLLEAGLMSEQLSAVYDFMEHIMVLMNYAKDAELHKVLQRMLRQTGRRAEQLEKNLSEYNVALPPRPPVQVTITETPTSISDAYVFKRAFNSIVWFLPDQMFCFKFSPTHNVRIMFKDLLLKELDMFEELQRFGLRKKLVTGTTRIPRRASGYEREPDRYGSSSSLESPENQI
ncbi:MAG TPA: hypothetical protein GXZ82_05785 [Firmicutes bacterium]|nr:hypothetical protein [Bacillota bacterium]